MTENLHPFERVGLGKAPFRVLRVHVDPAWKRWTDSTGVTFETKGGSSCDYCGTYILEIWTIRSADGRVFKVGSVCVGRAHPNAKDPRLEGLDRGKRDLRKAKKKAQRERDLARITAAKEALESDHGLRKVLTCKPHPHSGLAANGATLLDYANWIMDRAGHTGQMKVTRLVEKETKR